MSKRSSVLLMLPEPCLLAVLRACAEDQPTLFSAARAHSRLHQAAVVALSSIKALVHQQQTADNLVAYLSKYGHKVTSITLQGQGPLYPATLQQLAPSLQLSSLEISNLSLRLQPGAGFQGVLGPEPSLTRLQLHACTINDGEQGLAEALSLLPGLQHLSIENLFNSGDQQFDPCRFPWQAVQGLQQLTCLRLFDGAPYNEHHLRRLQSLTRLQELQLVLGAGFRIDGDMLAGMQGLTHLSLGGSAFARPEVSDANALVFDPEALAGKSLLQHLTLADGRMAGPGVAGASQLLSQLQQLSELTRLELQHCLTSSSCAPAGAYSALTASSKLQHLDLSKSVLPPGAWQHVFPAGRKLPQLAHLNISTMRTPDGPAAMPAGTLLGSCCPALGWLGMQGLTYTSEALLQLQQGLTALTSLSLDINLQQAVQGVCQLTQLQQLICVDHNRDADARSSLLALTLLQQLTSLSYVSMGRAMPTRVAFESKVPGDEPVWRQLLQHLITINNAEAAGQAAAALAE